MSKIGIVIPTYNSEKFIEECLSSINHQTFEGVINIYLVDDGSCDHTLELAKKYVFNDHINIQIFENEMNMRQGYSRNRMLDILDDEYVIFLDSDDFLEKTTIRRAIDIFEKKDYDAIFLDWIYYNEGSFKYRMNDKLRLTDELIGENCSDLLSLKVYYTTPAVYKTSFLKAHNIRYGEGYFYEDYEFMVQVAMRANSIYFLHFPLYIVRFNEESTTKSNYNTNVHAKSLHAAIEASLKHLYARNEYSIYHFYRYAFLKTLSYLKHRTPKRFRRKSLRNIIRALSVNQDYSILNEKSRLLSEVFGKRLIDKQAVNRIALLDYVNTKRKRVKSTRKKFKASKKNSKTNHKNPQVDIVRNKIVFAGFDFEYKGNSKYLYESINKDKFDVTFINQEQAYTASYYEALSSAKMIIIESWNQLKYKKKEGQVLIQLWHGSPLKKMTFATVEKYALRKNRNSRKQKFKNYSGWDYLLVDRMADKKYFDLCFPYHTYDYLEFGYPRVKWLVDNQNNEGLKSQIKEKYEIKKPLVLYVPTWRDDQNTDVFLEIEKLRDKYTHYTFLTLEHSYLSDKVRNDDIQELILISEYVISDYSSIIYDAKTINKKVILYQNDLAEYETYRGIFEERLDEFREVICFKEEQVEELLINYPDLKYPVDHYNYSETTCKFEHLFEKIITEG